MSDVGAYLDYLALSGFHEADAGRFISAWDAVETTYLDRLERAYGTRRGWRERFRAGAAETLRLVEECPREARFLAVDALAAGELGRERQRRLGERLTALIDAARAELDDPERVGEATSRWIAGVFFSRIYWYLVTGGGPPLRAQLSELMFLAVSAYFGTEAGLAELL